MGGVEILKCVEIGLNKNLSDEGNVTFDMGELLHKVSELEIII